MYFIWNTKCLYLYISNINLLLLSAERCDSELNFRDKEGEGHQVLSRANHSCAKLIRFKVNDMLKQVAL